MSGHDDEQEQAVKQRINYSVCKVTDLASDIGLAVDLYERTDTNSDIDKLLLAIFAEPLEWVA